MIWCIHCKGGSSHQRIFLVLVLEHWWFVGNHWRLVWHNWLLVLDVLLVSLLTKGIEVAACLSLYVFAKFQVLWVISLDELVALRSTEIANIITLSDILLLMSDILQHFLLNADALGWIIHFKRLFSAKCLLDMADVVLIKAAFMVIDCP